ncbi:hypothetical protein [Sulfurimicrobium lacus]|uniref:hypothetical protein n=1 Tax=Sulfurimicrobium lacus TaxID=2715678 RepID=UPI001565B322|nr:hypothetical protein [Sulfurimicrobium lacus]
MLLESGCFETDRVALLSVTAVLAVSSGVVLSRVDGRSAVGCVRCKSQLSAAGKASHAFAEFAANRHRMDNAKNETARNRILLGFPLV